MTPILLESATKVSASDEAGAGSSFGDLETGSPELSDGGSTFSWPRIGFVGHSLRLRGSRGALRLGGGLTLGGPA